MKAQIISINLNARKVANGKSYNGAEVSYQPEPYKGKVKDPSTRFVFGNSPIVPQLEELSVGDWVNIEFDDTKWKNPVSIVRTSGPMPSAPPASAPQQQSAPWVGSEDKDAKITRAVAFKGATEIVAALLTQDGAFPKASLKRPEFFVEQVIAMSKKFEPYLSLKDGEAVDNGDGTAEEASNFNQEDFEE